MNVSHTYSLHHLTPKALQLLSSTYIHTNQNHKPKDAYQLSCLFKDTTTFQIASH